MKIQTDYLIGLLGSESAARRFVDLFHQQWPLQLENMETALRDADWESLGNSAHGLKSQCRYMGLEELADHLQEIERSPEAPEVVDRMARVKNALSSL